MRTTIKARSDTLLQRRVRAGLSKVDLAIMAKIPHSSVIRAEQGCGISPKTAVALSNAMGVPFDDLFVINTGATRIEHHSSDTPA